MEAVIFTQANGFSDFEHPVKWPEDGLMETWLEKAGFDTHGEVLFTDERSLSSMNTITCFFGILDWVAVVEFASDLVHELVFLKTRGDLLALQLLIIRGPGLHAPVAASITEAADTIAEAIKELTAAVYTCFPEQSRDH